MRTLDANPRDACHDLLHRQRRFTFAYDPLVDDGVGRVSVSLDGKEQSFTLSRGMRKSGAVFIRFGLANIRRGGHSVEFYLDDITYTARRELDTRPAFVRQTTVEMPYPHKQAGRRY